jgi:hypothetical protein
MSIARYFAKNNGAKLTLSKDYPLDQLGEKRSADRATLI